MRGGSVREGRSPAECPDFRSIRGRGKPDQVPASLLMLCALGLDVGTVPTTMPSWEARLAGLIPGEKDMNREEFVHPSAYVHIFCSLCNTCSG